VTALRTVRVDRYTVRPDLLAAIPVEDRPDEWLVPADLFVHHADGARIDAVLAGEIAHVRVIDQATEEVFLVIREGDDDVLVAAVGDIATEWLAERRAAAVSS
jgi:hypothetical protein